MSTAKPKSPSSTLEADLREVSVVRNFTRLVRAFSVGIGVGLLPFLVESPFPGYQPLIHIFPAGMKALLLTLTPLLMGSIAITIDFYWDKSFPKARLNRWFGIALRSFVAGVVLLTVVYKYFLVPVDLPKGRELYAIGWSRLPDCHCVNDDAVCLEGIAYDAASCWGSFQINTIELVFQLSYLALNFGFGILIGLLMLKKRSRPEAVARTGSAKKPRKRKSQTSRQHDSPEATKDAVPEQEIAEAAGS